MKAANLAPLSAVIKSLVNTPLGYQRWEKAMLHYAFQQAAPFESRRVRYLLYKQGTLRVQLDSALALYDLRQRKKILLKQLNTHVEHLNGRKDFIKRIILY